MFTKIAVSLMLITLFFTMAGWSQAIPPIVETALAQGEVENASAFEPFPYTPDMKVLFEEMTLVQLLSEEYARAVTACAGVGLNNIKPLPDGPMILLPNAGDLAVNGSNVAIKLEPNWEITFIPRVPGQRIRVPVDVADKVAGQEVSSLSFDEAMQLMAADRLVWTAKDYGPFGNGHGLPGHIAECDPRYELAQWNASAFVPVIETAETKPVDLAPTVIKAAYTKPQHTPDMKVLFEEMTLVQLLSEEYARAVTACAGAGLNNIKPLPDGPMILLPNAGDLAVNGSNVAIKLEPNSAITFIPRVPGQRIRVPVDVADKVAGQEVSSLSFDEAMQLMAADRLVWTAKDYGPFGNGHGLPGHIAECDPQFSELVYKRWLR